MLCRGALHPGKAFITQYKYILIVPWTKTSQPSPFLGVHCCISEVWIPGKQCTHLAPKKNYKTKSVHWPRSCELHSPPCHRISCSTWSVSDKWCFSLPNTEASLFKYLQYPTFSPLYSLLCFCLYILRMVLKTSEPNYLILQMRKLRLRKALQV